MFALFLCRFLSFAAIQEYLYYHRFSHVLFSFLPQPFFLFAEILQSLLNLAEFMEHDVEALPISLSILAELAQKGHAYAKALHYRYAFVKCCVELC